MHDGFSHHRAKAAHACGEPMGNLAVVKRQVRAADAPVTGAVCWYGHFDQTEYSTPQVIPDPPPPEPRLASRGHEGQTHLPRGSTRAALRVGASASASVRPSSLRAFNVGCALSSPERRRAHARLGDFRNVHKICSIRHFTKVVAGCFRLLRLAPVVNYDAQGAPSNV